MSKATIYHTTRDTALVVKLIKRDSDGRIIKKQFIEFTGGIAKDEQNAFRPGVFITKNPALIEMIENDAAFKDGSIIKYQSGDVVAGKDAKKEESGKKAEASKGKSAGKSKAGKGDTKETPEAEGAGKAMNESEASGEGESTGTEEGAAEEATALAGEEASEDSEPTVVYDVTTVNAASEYLRTNFADVKAHDVNTKAKVLEVAKAKGVSFPGLS